jgi:putative ABC transport system permease protein
MIAETLRLAWINLVKSPRRTILTAGALANAVVGGLLFYGFTRHTYWGLAESFARGGNGHLQVADADWFDAATPEAHRVGRARLDAARAALHADAELGPWIEASTLRRQVMGMLNAGGRTGVFIGVGTDPAAESVLAPMSTPGSANGSAGRALVAGDTGVAILGTTLAARLALDPGGFATALVTTDKGMTNAMDLEVVGTARSGLDDLDRTLATLPLETALALVDGDGVDVLSIALRDTADTDRAVARARTILATHPELAVLPWYERADYYQAVRGLYDRIFGVFEALMALVTVLSLSHAVAAVVAERRHEIAMLRVIGLRRAQVAGLFVVEGALLGALGCVGGVVLSAAIAALTERLGGIPMPPPPGFTIGYAAMFRIDALGYAIVLPVTLLASVLASALPAWRATRGELSRGLAGLVVLLALLGVPSAAHAEDPAGRAALARAEAAGALPAGRCVVDLTVHDAAGETRWRVASTGREAIVVSTSLPEGRRQAVLQSGPDTWFQTEAMRSPMKVTPAQRVTGQLSAGDLLSPRLVDTWEAVTVRGAVVEVMGRAGAPWPRAELELDGAGRLLAGRFFAPSGKQVRAARWVWDGARLTALEVEDTTAKSRVDLGAPRCGAPAGAAVTPEGLLAAARALATEAP